ncbi:hypothetical protein [Streptomyces sp. RPT161]|uniref:hypothetical protein n=1 Tax=Streptomyces sp. RPT161 TaxID=3015993 RepID=UPI0022B90063|nr:hypothetical protein [Streptomyces sp. RPT161]
MTLTLVAVVQHDTLVEVAQGQLGTGVRSLAADDDPGAVGMSRQVDQAGQLCDLG